MKLVHSSKILMADIICVNHWVGVWKTHTHTDQVCIVPALTKLLISEDKDEYTRNNLQKLAKVKMMSSLLVGFIRIQR